MSRITDRAKFPIANFRSSGIHDDATSNTITITNDNVTISANVSITGDIDINGGTIDGVTIGGASAGAGTFTTLQADTSLNVDGTVTADGLTVDKTSGTDHIEVTNGTAGSDASPQFMDLTFTGYSNRDMARVRGVNRNSSRQGGSLQFETSNANSTDASTYKKRMFIDTNGDISFYEDTGTTPKLFWDASAERLGIGTSSPLRPLHISGAGDTGMMLQTTNANTDAEIWEIQAAGNASNNADLIFRTRANNGLGGSEAMRIDSSGRLLINATSAFATGYRQNIQVEGTAGGLAIQSGGTAMTAIAFDNGSGTRIGSIGCSNTATSYNESSDYRLKENVVDMTDAIDRVKALKPSRFNFIGDEATVDGFLAHEAQEVVPEAVTGEKDAVDEDGNIEIQQIDKSKLVPLLTGALKEAIARIETLEAQVATLQGN